MRQRIGCFTYVTALFDLALAFFMLFNYFANDVPRATFFAVLLVLVSVLYASNKDRSN